MSSSGSGRLILIVEDNDANLLLVQAALHRVGYRVEVARDAVQALDWLRGAKPGLILMDIQLPEVDGLALTRQLKADAATAAIPVVALTAYAMADDRREALEAGCDGYITKPFDPISLGAQLEPYFRPEVAQDDLG